MKKVRLSRCILSFRGFLDVGSDIKPSFSVSEDGQTANWTTADYLFSQDASCPDTTRIFQSVDYAEDRVTIFHSSYLLACAKGQERTSVAIGHYVLPPACVQEGYVSVYELRRYSGELHDFLPGHFGFSVTKAPNEN